MRWRSILLIIKCALLLACSQPIPPTGIVIESQPKTIPVNEYFALNINLADEKYRDIKPSDIRVEAIMPAHGHGMNVDPLISAMSQAGSYYAEGLLFHMRGDWEIIVYVNMGESIDTLKFNVTI